MNSDDRSLVVLDKMESVSNSLNNLTSSLNDLGNMYIAAKQLDKEIALLDHQLEAFKTQVGANLERFKITANILSIQLEQASVRIDKIVDKILDFEDVCGDSEKMERQMMLMNMLSQINGSFNNILMKLL